MNQKVIKRRIREICPEVGLELDNFNWELKGIPLKSIRYAGEMPENVARAIHFSDQMQVGAEYPPIIVVYAPDEKFDYELQDGFLRSFAALAIGMSTFPAYIGKQKSSKDISYEQLIELDWIWDGRAL